ncbi:MAG: TylF/MycF/NovP-related O-methyltransferase [Candidatus Omnitrophota bacterium]
MDLHFNYVRLFTHDFLFMRTLSLGMALAQMFLLLLFHPSKRSWRLCRLILKIKPRYSMLSVPRFVNLYALAQKINEQGLPGDIVECGVWNGGASALMGAAGQDGPFARARTQWLFDSFEGLPKPKGRDGQRLEKYYFKGLARGEQGNVVKIFEKLGVPLDNVKIIKGWLDATLPTATVDKIALLHIDTDWYDSVKVVLDYLYDKIVPGGFVVVDDFYFLTGCRDAVLDFLKERDIDASVLKKVDRSAVCFQKAPAAS